MNRSRYRTFRSREIPTGLLSHNYSFLIMMFESKKYFHIFFSLTHKPFWYIKKERDNGVCEPIPGKKCSNYGR